jgi:SpoVK/Ycf46/Vps4 family AAA+-type ATPase
MIRDDLSELTKAVRPVGGRLLLLTGDPGSGKTTFTRALIRQWQGWCKPIFVIDPEAFFDDSKYMTELLADAEEDDLPQACNDDEVREPKPWLLYIIEDADEYLTADGKARHGQAVSRALNLLDGMLGQGLNMLMLFSANLPEDKLNPAFIRPGRCLSKIEFGFMDTESAIAWMVQNGLDPDLLQEVGNSSLGFRRRQGFSLAELYAIKNRSAEALQAEVS